MTSTDTPIAVSVTAPETPLGTGEYAAEIRLTLTEDGKATLCADEVHSTDRSTRVNVWHGVDREWTERLRQGTAVVADMESMQALAATLAPLLERVSSAHECYWDGSNYRGRLKTADASDASGEIEELISRADWTQDVPVWSADEWIRGQESACDALCVVWQMDDAKISAADAGTVARLVSAAEEEARTDGVVLYGDLTEAFRDLIAEARNEMESQPKTGNSPDPFVVPDPFKPPAPS